MSSATVHRPGKEREIIAPSVPPARSVRYDDLDILRCPACGADNIRTAGQSPIERGRVAYRWFVCRSCGYGTEGDAILVSFWLSSNPAAVLALESYYKAAGALGEVEVER